jgi:hypothetical protein
MTTRLSLRLARVLISATLLILTVLTSILVTAQCFKLRGPLSGLEIGQWPSILGLASIVMLEATLPLASLVGSCLVFSRLRDEGIQIIVGNSGHRPSSLLWMPLAVGIMLGCLTVPFATTIGPGALDTLGKSVREGALKSLLTSPDIAGAPGIVATTESQRDGDVTWLAAQLRGQSTPTLIRTANARASWDKFGPQLTLGQTDVWSDHLRIRVKSGLVRLNDDLIQRHLRMLSAPNSLVSERLDDGNVHHVFVKQRRLSMAATTPFWVVLGALLGLLTGRLQSILMASASVGVCYWVLRIGELSSRAGALSPYVAAWLPTLGLALFVLALVIRLMLVKPSIA